MRKGREKKKSKLKILLVIAIVLVIAAGIAATGIFAKPYVEEWFYELTSIEDATTIEGEKLVFKSTMEYNRIVQYTFKDGLAYDLRIYEAYETLAKFDEAKQRYSDESRYKILFTDEANLRLEVRMQDLGVDAELTYEQIAEKYLVQIVGAYEIIK